MLGLVGSHLFGYTAVVESGPVAVASHPFGCTAVVESAPWLDPISDVPSKVVARRTVGLLSPK